MASLQNLIIGTAVIGVGALIYYLSDDGKSSSTSSQVLRKDQVLAILKDLKKEFSNVYITIATFANSVKEQSGGRLPESALKEILSTQTPIPSYITRAENKVYELHGINEEELKQSIENYKTENDIQVLIEEMKAGLDMAYKGVLPVDNNPLPDILTPELTLKVLFDMLDSGKYVTYKQLSSLKSRGVSPNPNNPEFIKAIQDMEVEAEQEKNYVFEKYGLTQLEESPAALIRKAQQRYSANDPSFKQKVSILEEEYSYTMSLLMEDKLPAEEVQRLMKKFDRTGI